MISTAHKFRGVFDYMVEDSAPFQSYFAESVSREVDGIKMHTRRVGPPSSEDWDRAMSFAHFLMKFHDATLTLSATKVPTSNLILKVLIGLKMEIEAKVLDDRKIVLQNVAKSMKLKFDKYWGKFEDTCLVMFISQVLDPRFKFQLLEIILNKLNYDFEKLEEVKGKVKKGLNDLYLVYKGTNFEESNVGIRLEEDDGDGDDIGDDLVKTFNRQRRNDKIMEISNEVDKYLNDAYESTSNSDFDLLRWWRVNRSVYPILSRIARDILAIPTSTVASENAFS